MTLTRLLSALLLTAAPLCAAHATLPRFPQPYGDRIVFVADGNVWSVPKAGGTAVRLTSAQGQDMLPRVSPDGRWIAYTEASKAGTDIWVIPAEGGAARRLTFHPTTEARHRRPSWAGQHGGHLDPGFPVRRLSDQAKPVEHWIQEMYKVPVAGGRADAHADRQRGGLGDLRSRRPHHRLQPHLPELPHLEALQRRPGAAGVHLRLQHTPAHPDHRLVRHQHLAHVVRAGASISSATGTASARQHLGL